MLNGNVQAPDEHWCMSNRATPDRPPCTKVPPFLGLASGDTNSPVSTGSGVAVGAGVSLGVIAVGSGVSLGVIAVGSGVSLGVIAVGSGVSVGEGMSVGVTDSVVGVAVAAGEVGVASSPQATAITRAIMSGIKIRNLLLNNHG
jgi:hypothetical protein